MCHYVTVTYYGRSGPLGGRTGRGLRRVGTCSSDDRLAALFTALALFGGGTATLARMRW